VKSLGKRCKIVYEVREAAKLLAAGKVVAFPTETVYGLGADASNPEAVRRIFEIKGRPADHPVIVHLSHPDQLSEWAADIPDEAYQLAERFWPGPLTMILNRNKRVPDEVTGGQDTVGLRIPAHPVALALLRKFGGGIAAPSANRFGRISPTTAQHVLEDLGEELEMIVDAGPCLIGLESAIINLSGPEPMLLRPGSLTVKELEAVLDGKRIAVPEKKVVLRAPGMLASHYAPRTPFAVIEAVALPETLTKLLTRGETVAVMTVTAPENSWPKGVTLRSMPPSPSDYACEMYSVMRKLDNGGFDHIVAVAPPDSIEWLAVMDRLTRAAG
jgi:L-threonylcarbamoyladenylate synthase